MISVGRSTGAEFVVANTDAQALDPVSMCEKRIQMGTGHHRGAGRGRPAGQSGRAAAQEESIDDIKSSTLNGLPTCAFITAGMGGGTGTGAAPVIAKRARRSRAS